MAIQASVCEHSSSANVGEPRRKLRLIRNVTEQIHRPGIKDALCRHVKHLFEVLHANEADFMAVITVLSLRKVTMSNPLCTLNIKSLLPSAPQRHVCSSRT